MNLLKRLFRIGSAEANAVIDKLEDPIKMTEQGIREMQEQLTKSLQGLAEIKAMAIRARNEVTDYSAKAEEWENKAMLLLQKAKRQELETAEADRLAAEALVKKEECHKHVQRATADKTKFEAAATSMEQNIQTLKSNISQWENELKDLKARVKVSSATKELNKQLAQIDPSGTVAMLERMKEKVAVEESLAESYGMIANESKSIEEEIDKALNNSATVKASEALTALKAKMALDKEGAKENGLPA